MKNKFYEKRIASAKRYAKKYRFGTQPSLTYSYEGRARTNWDDFSFKFGQYVYYVEYCHLRYLYEQECQRISNELMAQPLRNPLYSSKKIYKKVGKSRKKVAVYEMTILDNEREYFEKWRALEQELKRKYHKQVHPYIKITQCKNYKYVDIASTTEILSEEDVLRFIEVLKLYLQDRYDLPDYLLVDKSYGKDDYNMENPL